MWLDGGHYPEPVGAWSRGVVLRAPSRPFGTAAMLMVNWLASNVWNSLGNTDEHD
jgi:hypothetical protein